MTPLRVLFIEDSDDDVLLLLRLLKQAGYGVTFERADTAEALARALEKTWDLFISDHSMPNFTGTEALRQIRAHGCDVPFIFVSGTIGEEAAVAALKVGAQDYLMKTNLNRFIPAVQRELRDVQTRREHRQLEQQVHQSRRFEAIGRLAGGVAHDFNNVVGAITAWAEVGIDETAADSRERDRFQKIRAQAERAAGVTRQLLAFARRQILEPKNTDINGLVREGIELLRSVIGERVEIQMELADDLPCAWIDAGQIEQVLMNLCLNARDAMPDGGRLLIRTRNVEISQLPFPHTSEQSGRYLLLEVVDAGTGMDADTIEHIFEPFFSTKDPGEGTGLGLATAYGIVKQHKGFIAVESALGQGATFRVYLPAGHGKGEISPSPSASRVRSRGHETVLLAEDNQDLREAGKAILENLGYKVILAEDGEEAVGAFRRSGESIDLAFLDVVMPKLNGSEAYAQIAAIKPNVPVLFTTGYASENELIAARTPKHAALLPKPYNSEQLARKLRELLDVGPA